MNATRLRNDSGNLSIPTPWMRLPLRLLCASLLLAFQQLGAAMRVTIEHREHAAVGLALVQRLAWHHDREPDRSRSPLADPAAHSSRRAFRQRRAAARAG